MENKKNSKKDHTNNPIMLNPRKRRRSHSRKTLSNCLINFAEARREVARALRRHRSSVKTITTSTTISQYGSRRGLNFNYPTIDNMGSSFSSSSPSLPKTSEDKCPSCPLVKAHVQGGAGPTWSTNGPSIVSGPTSIYEDSEFDDENSFAATYSWWVGFLESLDEKNQKKPNFDRPAGMLGKAHISNLDSLDEGPNSIDDIKDEMLVYEVLNIS